MPAYAASLPVDAVELDRVADRLVHLQLHLLGVDHDGRHRRRALVGAEERNRLLADARRLAVEAELSTYSQPACALSRRARSGYERIW